MHAFIGLLMAITTALLVRLDPTKLKDSIRIYLPTIFTALFVIGCRVLFVPNAFLNLFFPNTKTSAQSAVVDAMKI